MTANENELLNSIDGTMASSSEPFDFEELEEKLQSQLDDSLADLAFLKEEKDKIGSPDNLGNVITEVVWEQFLNQVAATAGEDFIRENNGLNLDLRNDAHIQTTENFAEGKIAQHNTKIDYQQRYDDWQNNFQKDPSVGYTRDNYRYNDVKGVWEKKDNRSDSWKPVLKKDARDDFDKDRPSGSATNNTNMDHTISAAEIIRDPAANAHMTRDEQIEFANSDKNLNLMDSAANKSKNDLTMSEFLDSERNGQKPAERFDIDEEALRQKDAEARKEYEKQKAEAEQRSIQAGKQSQKEEAFRIGGKALRAAVMALLAGLLKEIIRKLVQWFKSSQKSLGTLLNSIKGAVHDFIGELKTYIISVGTTVVSTVATAIFDPVVSTINKVFIMLRQGGKSLIDAVNYIKNPQNKGKPFGRLLLEAGKIVIAGITGIGAIVLGDVIEKGLMVIPVFAVQIPLVGSLANILGIFFGAVVAGIIGAIAINLIEKRIEKSLNADNIESQIDKGNKVLYLQHQVQKVNEDKFDSEKNKTSASIQDRHVAAANTMRESLNKIVHNCSDDDSIQSTMNDIDALLNEMGD